MQLGCYLRSGLKSITNREIGNDWTLAFGCLVALHDQLADVGMCFVEGQQSTRQFHSY